MTQEAPTLFPEKAEVTRTELNFLLYWRKPPSNWIVCAPGWPQEYAKRLKRGWTPLPQYGTFTPGLKSEDSRGHDFNPHREPWRIIFQKGGAEEFPVDQVIAYNLHLAPPYKEVAFPQLEGVEVDVLDCPECNTQPFHATDHLAQHLRIRHEYTRVDLKVYGEEMGIDFTRRTRKRAEVRKLAPEDLALQELSQKPVERGERCGIGGCTWSPAKRSKQPAKALAGHKRMKHQSVPSTAQKGVTDGRTEIQEAQPV